MENSGTTRFTSPEMEAALHLIQLSGDTDVDVDVTGFSSSSGEVFPAKMKRRRKESVCDHHYESQGSNTSDVTSGPVVTGFDDDCVAGSMRRKRKKFRSIVEIYKISKIYTSKKDFVVFALLINLSATPDGSIVRTLDDRTSLSERRLTTRMDIGERHEENEEGGLVPPKASIGLKTLVVGFSTYDLLSEIPTGGRGGGRLPTSSESAGIHGGGSKNSGGSVILMVCNEYKEVVLVG
ncbi:hypothetical protein E3N88_45013 [Mikania micrantha]|uniref:Uncharacterized protein n=1 Tax=Mikania micrantha TaxID=192012 RepID=A0A5N6LAC8_9ASTR|nr:hypothetical protein E3N88_45013 [Mikania micrantha]